MLLCGRSFSGKSTVAGWLQTGLAAEVVSLDALNAERGLDGGQGIPLEEWARTNELATAQVEALLRSGRTAVVDDTASPRFLRDGWRDCARRAGAAFVLLHVQADDDVVRQRLLANRGSGERADVVDAVMAEHLASFEPPQPDEAALTHRSGEGSPAELVEAVRRRLAPGTPGR